MLCLRRRVGESIVIGDGILVTVLEIKPGRPGTVRLGIAAPAGVRVDREEVRDLMIRTGQWPVEGSGGE